MVERRKRLVQNVTGTNRPWDEMVWDESAQYQGKEGRTFYTKFNLAVTIILHTS